MFEGITNWVEDKVAGYAKTGIQAGGSLAGNAVGGIGSLVESAGRSAGDTVAGGIGGVGGRINNYGDGIKRSMSADGPVSGSEKKTAVKPAGAGGKAASTAQKTTASPAATAKKTTPSTGNVQKSAPGGPQKLGTTQRPGQQLSKTGAAGTAGSKSAPTQPLQNVRSTAPKANAGGSPASRTGNVGSATNASKSPANVTKPNTKSIGDGKIRISPESMPRGLGSKPGARPASRPATGTTQKHDASDPIGIGENFGDVSKGGRKGNDTKSQQSQFQPQSKAQQGAQRKPSASDPLALGEEINKIGQKKQGNH